MSSQVEICNRALEQVNADPITGFDASPTLDDKSTRLCRRLFPQLRDSMLRGHVWPFATARTTLAALATGPAWGYFYSYQLPSDCLRVLRLQNPYTSGITGWSGDAPSYSASYDDDAGPSYKIEGGAILTDSAPPLAIAYTRQMLDPASFDALFTDALVATLAVNLCMPLTRDGSMKQALMQEAQARLSMARGVASTDGGDHTRLPMRALAVRY